MLEPDLLFDGGSLVQIFVQLQVQIEPLWLILVAD